MLRALLTTAFKHDHQPCESLWHAMYAGLSCSTLNVSPVEVRTALTGGHPACQYVGFTRPAIQELKQINYHMVLSHISYAVLFHVGSTCAGCLCHKSWLMHLHIFCLIIISASISGRQASLDS